MKAIAKSLLPAVWVALVPVAVLLSACGTPSQVRLEMDGLHYENGGLAVRFADAGERAFIDDHWKMDNWEYFAARSFEVTEYGHKTTPAGFSRKKGRPFEGVLRVDMDNNGRVEGYSTFFTDLELTHEENDGQIWVLMRELPKHRAKVKLDVLVDTYAETLSFERYTRTGPYDVWVNGSKVYAARVVSREEAVFGPFEAVVATIEIANLAQIQLDPQSRMGYIRVLLARVSGFETNIIDSSVFPTLPRSHVGLLVVGYFGTADYFEAGIGDFEKFLAQFTLDGKPMEVVLSDNERPDPEKPGAAAAEAPTPEPAEIEPDDSVISQ
jgi:hypothetical protein